MNYEEIWNKMLENGGYIYSSSAGRLSAGIKQDVPWTCKPKYFLYENNNISITMNLDGEIYKSEITDDNYDHRFSNEHKPNFDDYVRIVSLLSLAKNFKY